MEDYKVISELLAIGLAILLGIVIILIQEYKSLKKENKKIKEVYEDSIIKQCVCKNEKGECGMEKMARSYKSKYDINKKQCDELENMLKALICKYANNEVEIDETAIEKAKRGNLYLENAYLKYARKAKVLFTENYFETEKESN